MTRLLLLAAACLACTCTPLPGPEPVEPPVPVEPPAQDDCVAAGSRLAPKSDVNPDGLGCLLPNGLPAWQTPGGTPFAEACERALEDGRNWHPELLRCIDSCDQIEAAYEGRRTCPAQ